MITAIYHLEAKVITRGIGRSAVAASAYMSCSEITNEYDGIKHDYTKKGGLISVTLMMTSEENIPSRLKGTRWLLPSPKNLTKKSFHE